MTLLNEAFDGPLTIPTTSLHDEDYEAAKDQLAGMSPDRLADLAQWTTNTKLSKLATTKLQTQLAGMTPDRLADLAQWTTNTKLSKLATTKLQTQLAGMTPDRLADLAQWTTNTKLSKLALSTSRVSVGSIALVNRAAQRLTRSLSEEEGHLLAQGASYFASVDAIGVLSSQAEALLENPADWVHETEQAAAKGDVKARDALLLVRYLLGCFTLLAGRLNPSAKTIERVGPLLSLSALLFLATGMIGSSNPKLLEKVNDQLSSPLGIIGVYLGFTAGAVVSGRRESGRKHKTAHRSSSKPRRSVLRRYTAGK